MNRRIGIVPLAQALPDFLPMNRDIGRGIDAQAHPADAGVDHANPHDAAAELNYDMLILLSGQDQHAVLLCVRVGDLRGVVYRLANLLSMSVGR
jgi:hypothetical protein